MLLAAALALLLSCAGCAGNMERNNREMRSVPEQAGQSAQTEAKAPAAEEDGNVSAGGILDMLGVENEVELYRPVLDPCCRCLRGELPEDEYDRVPSGLSELSYWMEPEEAMNTVGYWFGDLNGDGISELLVGMLDTDGESSAKGLVLGGYTVADREIVCVLEGWNRNSYQWLGDNRFLNSGSGGAMYSMFGTFRLPPDARELECEDLYFTWEQNEDYTEIGYYHNTTGVWEKESADEMNITGEEFWELRENLASEAQSVDYTPFARYQYADGFERTQ